MTIPKRLRHWWYARFDNRLQQARASGYSAGYMQGRRDGYDEAVARVRSMRWEAAERPRTQENAGAQERKTQDKAAI